MATITAVENIQDPQGKVKGWHWANVTESDVCETVRVTGFDDMTLSIADTPGGSTTTLKVSSDEAGSDEWTATDLVTSLDVGLTVANTSSLIAQNGIYYTPTATGGSSQSLDITLIAK